MNQSMLYMKRILSLVVLLLVSYVGFAQAPSNYTNINGRYRWIAGMFDSTFHIPKGSTPSLRTGGSTNAGGLFYNTSDSSVYTYTGTQWIKVRGSINPSDTTNKYVTQVYKKSGSDSIFYVKGGVHTWAFNDSTGSPGGGGGGKVYYFNGGVNMGTIGGFQMYELGDTANTGTAANFTRSTTGNIANFITDSNKPGLLQIPAGVWSVDAWLSETGGGSNHAEIWVEVEKWDGSTITTIATSPIEQITEGATPNLYSWSVSIPTTSLTVTDRIIIQFYISNTNGKTVTLYTQNGYVGEVHTTFTTGIGAINGLTAPAQYLVTGASGTDFNINSATATHTFNLPTASATNRGALSTTDWSTFNNKIGGSLVSGYLTKATGTNTIDTSQLYQNSGLIGIGTTTPAAKLDVNGKIQITGPGNWIKYDSYGYFGSGSAISGGASSDIGIRSENKILFSSGGAIQRMLLDVSGNLGIGGSPDSLLTVELGTHLKRGVRMSGLPAAPGTKALRIDANGTLSVADTLTNGVSGSLTANFIPKATGTTTLNNSPLSVGSGVVGLGLGVVPPNSWSNYWALQLANGVSLASYNYADIPIGWLGTNAYHDGIGDIRVSNGAANKYLQDRGNHKWYVAGYGASGSYISWTQPMILDTLNRLTIGVTTPDSMFKVAQGVHLERGVRMSGLPTASGTRSLRIDPNGTVSISDTLANGVSGTGTTNYIPKFTGTSAIGNSVIQESSNLIGIGMTPVSGYKLNVSGLQRNEGANTTLNFGELDANNIYFQALNLAGNTSKGFVWYGVSEYMRLDASGNLGLGTSSPSTKLDVNGTGKFSGKLTVDASVSGDVITNLVNNSATGFGLRTVGGASGAGYALSVNNYLGTELMQVNGAGNLGLGVTPSAWGRVAFQVNNTSLFEYSANNSIVASNFYFDGTSNRYLTSGFASYYQQYNGGHAWAISPSGTAGNAISFTQAMTLTSGGLLGIGATNPTRSLQITRTSTAFINAEGSIVAIGSSDTELRLFGNNTETMTLKSGNVGIGTTSPQQKLHIAGDVQIGESSGGEKLRFVGASNKYNFQLGKQINGDNIFEITPSTAAGGTTFSTPAFVVTYDSKIGIGTTSPTQLLTLEGADGYLFTVQENGANKSRFQIYQDDGGSSLVAGYNSTATNMYFYTGGSERMRITSGGNVGIGTTNPGYKLDILASNSTDADIFRAGMSGVSNGFTVQRVSSSFRYSFLDGNVGIGTTSPDGNLVIAAGTNGAASVGGYLGLTTGTNNSKVRGAAIETFTTNTGNDHGLRFYTNEAATSPAERMRITSGGNVTIGSTTADFKFNVFGGSIGWGTSAYQGVLSDDGSNPVIATYGAKNLVIKTNDLERMRITSGGELLINTTSDAGDYKLQVNGNSYLNGVVIVKNAVGIDKGASNTIGDGSYIALSNPANSYQYLQQLNANYGIDFWTYDGGWTKRATLTSGGNLELTGSIKTAAPSGYTAKPWKLGEVASTSVTLDTTRYVAVDIDGVVYYLALVTLN